MNTPRIFLSHSSQDNDFGMRLTEDLRQALGDEEAVWCDAHGGLYGGDVWWRKIMHELTMREVFIVVLSPDAVSSQWVDSEINMAWRQKLSPAGKLIIPILYRSCQVRPDLDTLQVISFLSPRTYEDAFNELLLALKLPPRKKINSAPDAAARAISVLDTQIASSEDQRQRRRQTFAKTPPLANARQRQAASEQVPMSIDGEGVIQRVSEANIPTDWRVLHPSVRYIPICLLNGLLSGLPLSLILAIPLIIISQQGGGLSVLLPIGIAVFFVVLMAGILWAVNHNNILVLIPEGFVYTSPANKVMHAINYRDVVDIRTGKVFRETFTVKLAGKKGQHSKSRRINFSEFESPESLIENIIEDYRNFKAKNDIHR